MQRSHLANLTEERVEEIYIEIRIGTPLKEIADMFGVSRGLIEHVNLGISWAVKGFDYPIRSTKKVVKQNEYEFPIEDHYDCVAFRPFL